MIATMPIAEAARPADAGLAEINAKLDALTRQVEVLAAQAERAERTRADRAELMRDLTPILNDAYRLTTEQLEEVQQYVELGDLLRLFKRLLRNTTNLERMLDQLESVSELADTLMPMGDVAFARVVDTLELMERKGYFAFAQGGMQIADTVVSSFTPADVKKLGDNVVLILNTVKDMTQPEIMQFVRNTLVVAEREVEGPVDISYPALFKQLRDPAVRRGLALTLRMLRVVGAQAENGNGKG
jgi:uncharacterized protein YjgD (DUF1641 family)